MPRNTSGVYELPLPPVIADTTILANWANTTMADLELAMTESLSREGEGGMNAPLRFEDGTNAAPGVAFVSETNSGLYRFAAGDLRMVIGTQDQMRWTATGAQFWDGSVFVTPIGEAPQDSKYYSRIDATWVEDPRIAQNITDIADNTEAIGDNIVAIAANTTEINKVKGVGWTTENTVDNAAAIAANDVELADHENRITALEGGSDTAWDYGSLADGGYVGIVTNFTASEGIADGAAVQVSAGANQVSLADNATEINSAVIAVNTGTTTLAGAASRDMLLHGYLRNDRWTAWSVGATVWLGTAGALTATKPTGGAMAVRVGIAVAAKTIYVSPQQGYVTT
jgi:hypothetical protein